MTEVVKVSVVVSSYNHEKYISDCINGILMQQVNFPIEVNIGDDCSTDDTQNIIRKKIQENHDPLKKFNLLFHEKNLRGPSNIPGKLNFIVGNKSSEGEYIALCEGDDYWSDPLKLQKQVDFLDSNPLYSLCGANWEVRKGDLFFSNESTQMDVVRDVFHPIDFLSVTDSPIHTATVLYRNIFDEISFDWTEFEKFPIGDVPLFFILSLHGKVKKLNDVVSVYRRDVPTSATSTRGITSIKDGLIDMLKYLDELSEHRLSINIKHEISFINAWSSNDDKPSKGLNYYWFLLKYRKRLGYSYRDLLYILRHRND